MKFLFLLIALLVSGVAHSVQSVVVYAGVRCDGCTSTQMAAVAKAQGVGNRYVVNLTGNHLGYFLVENERIDTGGRTITVATPLTPDPDLISYLNVASQVYAATNSTMLYHVGVALPKAGTAPNSNGISAQSAYDVIPDGPKRTSVESWLQNLSNWPSSQSLLFEIQATLQSGKILGGAPIKIEFQANFPDGSHVDVLYDSETQQCRYVPGTAYDSHGNHIPDKVSDLQGREFDFDGPGNPNDRINWSKLIQAWGVTFGNGGGSGGHGWACVSTTDPETHEVVYTCTQY